MQNHLNIREEFPFKALIQLELRLQKSEISSKTIIIEWCITKNLIKVFTFLVFRLLQTNINK